MRAGRIHAEQFRMRITRAEGIHAIESVLSPAIPEVAIVENSIDDRRRIARRTAPDVDGSTVPIRDAEYWIGDCGFIFSGLGQNHIVEVKTEYSLRPDNIVVLRYNRRSLIVHVSQPVQREISDAELVIGAESRLESGGVGRGIAIAVNPPQTWISLVERATICTSIKVAACACRIAVAAKLHFPEKSFAQRDCRRFILDHAA